MPGLDQKAWPPATACLLAFLWGVLMPNDHSGDHFPVFEPLPQCGPIVVWNRPFSAERRRQQALMLQCLPAIQAPCSGEKLEGQAKLYSQLDNRLEKERVQTQAAARASRPRLYVVSGPIAALLKLERLESQFLGVAGRPLWRQGRARRARAPIAAQVAWRPQWVLAAEPGEVFA